MARKVQDIENHRNTISELYLNGHSFRSIQKEIAIRHGTKLALNTIFEDCKKLRADWLEARNINLDESLAMELEKLDKTEAAAWAAWTASMKQSHIKTRQKGKPSSNTSGLVIMSTTEAQTDTLEMNTAGDPRFLAVILKCSDSRCRLLGLYKTPAKEPGDETDVPVQGNQAIPESFTENPTFEIIGGSRPPITSEDELPYE